MNLNNHDNNYYHRENIKYILLLNILIGVKKKSNYRYILNNIDTET